RILGYEKTTLAYDKGGSVCHVGGVIDRPGIVFQRLGLAGIKGFRKKRDGGSKRLFQIDVRHRQAGVGLAERAGGRRVAAEHEARMLREPAIDANGGFIGGRSADLLEVEPRYVALSLPGLALAEEEDVND